MPHAIARCLINRWRRSRRLGKLSIVAALIVAFQAIAFGGLVAAAAIPDGPIVTHLRGAFANGELGPNYYPDRVVGIADGFGECVLAGTGLGHGDTNLVHRAAYMPRLSNCSNLPTQLNQLEQAKPLDKPADSYARYWAGYTAISRPILAVSGVAGLHLAGGVLLAAAFAAFMTAGRRLIPGSIKLALLAPTVATTNLMSLPSNSFLHALATAAMLGGAAATLWGFTRWGLPGALAAAALSGAVVNYVDLLTTPAIGWGLSAFVVALACWRLEVPPADDVPSTRNVLRSSAATAGAWIGGYALTWVSRWIISAMILGPTDVWRLVRYAVTYRIDGEHNSVLHFFGAATVKLMAAWWQSSTTPFVAAAVAVATVVAIALSVRRGGWRNVRTAAVLASPCLLFIAWWEMLSNHSQIHTFFVVRTVPVAIGIILAAALTPLAAHHGAGRREAWKAEVPPSMRAEPQKATA